MIDSPTKSIRPLELHSPNNANVSSDHSTEMMMASPPKQPNSAMKYTPLSSTGGASSAPRMPSSEDIDDCDNENRRIDNGVCRDESFMVLSPIGRVDFGTPNTNENGMIVSETPAQTDARVNDSNYGSVMDSSFPDRDVEIHSPKATADDDNEDEGETEESQEATEEERRQREIEESEALARQLMAEEAMASYAMSTEYLRENADQFSSEDLAALQAAMADEDPEAEVDANVEAGRVDEGDDEEEDNSQEMSYDALLRLGEQIGDVKEERWAMVAHEKINQLPTLRFVPSMAEGKEENHTEVKCQVCQFPYEEGDVLRRLPCQHCFHKDCVDSWLGTKDTCALCRKSIVQEK